MLLKGLLKSPRTSSNLLVFEPFRDVDPQEIVKEVIGLANAAVDGPRHILFGVNPASVEGDGVVGIPDSVATALKRAHRLVSLVVEPSLDLAFVYDQVNGKLVGALEIDGCDFGPYFVGQDLPGSLSRGQCWIREDRELRAVERADLLAPASAGVAATPQLSPENVEISVGFNDEPDCNFLELPIPDTSNPPFADQLDSVSKTATLTQVIKDTVSTVTTQILRLGQGGAASTIVGSTDIAATGTSEDAGRIFADAQNHYYFEEKAVKVVFCIQNSGDVPIDEASIEFGFPRIPDFEVADRIYVSPFDKRSPNEIRNMGYPDVESRGDAIFVRSDVQSLGAGSTRPALRCPLRLAVGPGMQGRKLGIQYVFRGPDNKVLSKGGLKIRFGEVET